MKNILMCEPKYFDVIYDINPWMTDKINKVDKNLAMSQWSALKNAISTVAEVKLIEPDPSNPDLVFTANAGFVDKELVIVSTFSKIERKNEEGIFLDWFLRNNYSISQLSSPYEGEGDHLVDSYGRHWVGYGFRTSIDVKKELDTLLDTDIQMLELIDPRWYHLDTCFCPLPNGEIYWYPGAFSERSKELILNSFKNHVFAHYDDALAFSCNTVAIGNKLFMPLNTYSHSTLANIGYEVYQFELSEFLKSGGAAKCLTLFI